MLSEEDRNGVDVSIVIPAYNVGTRIAKGLDSILSQTYPRERMQVVVTDDCSSDGTWCVIQEYAARYPDLFDIDKLETPSESPSRPRNRGIERAKGKYIFFLDADDWLGPEAVERMLDHATEWDSDVLLVKLIGENGRKTPRSMFTHNQPMADLRHSKVCWTFAPLKLFRRELIADMKFSDDMPEDIPFVLEAYLRSKVISIAADYDYYHVSFDPERGHASVTSWDDPHSNIRVFQRILHLQKEYGKTDEELSVVWKRIVQRDVEQSLDVSIDKSVKLSLEELLTLSTFIEKRLRTNPNEKLAKYFANKMEQIG